ncbi:type II toxin-antitoxin system VapC family toxin [[Limnothrix rosea] IAM M-220]|uniref:type II toxin-antitoxin system VapC family toxin n=1 Tax=[Limnothrix rosea] IAM M-220 TaxID=454133 RepID=UPI000961EA3A|nr:type II toxin-antitoxin system VapC family toxin [[Limnothrix rosea] IAM M-220]OKH18595.1 twitching motility protein PilT [[Limnothrix rosea] IAM M-220]
MTTKGLLLDTHIWIWAMTGDLAKLSESYMEAIAFAETEGELAVSAISVWEVGMLEAKGRIDLGGNCKAWVNKALSFPGLKLIPLTPEIAIQSSRLPGEIHGDPADRILAATCLVTDRSLLTKDRKLIDYSKQGHISVLPS